MTLPEALASLYAREINCGLSSLYDAGWTVWIGDDLNGYFAVETFDSLDDVPAWLLEKAEQWERKRPAEWPVK